MQKKLIALAVAGLASTAAFAQSNVTVYGVVDMYGASAGADGAKRTTSINSGGWTGSRLGFKGTEDLGNGLKAIFTLEYGLTTDANTGVGSGTTARQQFVGLQGGFGTVVAGRLQTAGYDFSALTNPLHGSIINPMESVTNSVLIRSGNNSRVNNGVAYISPSFGGLTLAYNHARLTETAFANASQNDAFANLVSATYTAGPLALSGIYTRVSKNNIGNIAGTADTIKEWGLGGSYDFGVAKLLASVTSTKTDLSSDASRTYQLSGVVPVSVRGNVVLSYAKTKNEITAANDDNKSYTLAYKYDLSKRTSAYAGYQRVSNDSGARLGTAVNATLLPVAGGDANALVGGITHKF